MLLPLRYRPVAILLAFLPLACAKAPEPHEGSPPAPVKAVRAQTASFGEWTPLLGTTQPLPAKSAQVGAAVAGQVVSLLPAGKGVALKEGALVQAGQVIVQLDDQLVRASRDKVAATLTETEEQTKQARIGIELAEIEVRRLEELNRAGTGTGPLPLVSRVELEKARLTRKDADSRLLAAEARQAAVRAELKGLEAQLDYFSIRTPIAGHLGELQVRPGQNLTPGTPVTEVVDLDQVDVLCFVPPHVIGRLAPDQAARLSDDTEATGKVVFLAVHAQPETGNFVVKVRFPNKDGEGRLRANTVLRPQVRTQPATERLTIPEAALLEDQGPPAVIVVQEVKSETHDGHEEMRGKARKLRAILGVRDREQHRVELLRLEGTKKADTMPSFLTSGLGQAAALLNPLQAAWMATTMSEVEWILPGDVLLIVEGAHGLRDDDAVKVED